jgi:peroxiredoxin
MRILAGAVAVLFVGSLAVADDLKLGDVVPDLEFKTVDGKDHKLSEWRGEKGKVLVIYFQSKNCPSAITWNDIKKIAEKFNGRDSAVQFLAVWSYGKDNEGVVKGEVEGNKIWYPCVADGDDKLTNHLGASKVNQTFVLDKEGKLVYRGGFTSKKEPYTENAVMAALGKGTAPASDNKFSG